MPNRPPTIAEEVDQYLRTGHHDMAHAAWPGDFLQRAHLAHDALRGALMGEVQRRASGRAKHPLPEDDITAFTRRKVDPMVRGLFPKAEQDTVLAVLEKSVLFVTGETIERLLRESRWHRSAWDIANLYLASVGAELLGDEEQGIVGLSEETTCYVSPAYFAEGDPFADFVVHEAAHVFHNCKRRTVGLPETKRREWLLDIEYGKRETFAYACEAYARILERGRSAADRRRLAVEYGTRVRLSDERVDPREVATILYEATEARNGWKAILARCAPLRRVGRASSTRSVDSIARP